MMEKVTHSSPPIMSTSTASSSLEPALPQYYTCWGSTRCAYEVHGESSDPQAPALLLIPPIGVGLSRHFWDRFIATWLAEGHGHRIYSPDLLGCGDSDRPRAACTPEDWAEQLKVLVEHVIQGPVVVISQGASLPIALELIPKLNSEQVKGLITAGPPAWPVITGVTPNWQRKVIWNLLDSPLGRGFYQYARRPAFLKSFSVRQLFDSDQDVDQEWLQMLDQGSQDPASRHAVFSFLAGFWRNNYESRIRSLNYPTLVVIGETASSISQSGKQESPDERLQIYLDQFPQGEGAKISGRNVLPYESTPEFVKAVAAFSPLSQRDQKEPEPDDQQS